MYGLSFLPGGTNISRHSGTRTSPHRLQRRPCLEELERRDVPSPVAASVAALPATLARNVPGPSVIQSSTVNVTQVTSFDATHALTATTPNAATTVPASPFAGNQLFSSPLSNSQSLGLPTAGLGVAVNDPYLTSSNAFPTPVGVPNAVRSGPATLVTVGSDASLPGTSPYAQQDIALTGGGGVYTEYRAQPSYVGTSEESEDSSDDDWILDIPEGGLIPTTAIFQEAVFQLTV